VRKKALGITWFVYSNNFGVGASARRQPRLLVDMRAGVLTAQSDGAGRRSSFTISLSSIQASAIKLSSPGAGAVSRRRSRTGDASRDFPGI
jgi:hypothetical protein